MFGPRLAFLHVPKTGGTYLVQKETGKKQLIPMRYLGHRYVITRSGAVNPLYYLHSPDHYYDTIPLWEVRQHVLVSTVRNIFSWLVSYAWHAGGWNPRYCDPNHYDYAAANKGFEYLLKTIAGREDLWPNRKFIHCQFFCSSGEWVVDWLNRTESLDQDLEALADRYHFPFARQKKQRVGHETDYRTYYTDSLVDLVYATWGRELNLFGYEFDGAKAGAGHPHRAVGGKAGKRFQYVLDKDEFKVDGITVER